MGARVLPLPRPATSSATEHHGVFSATTIASLWIGYWNEQSTAEGCDAAATSICAFSRRLGRPVSVLAVLGPGVRPAFGMAVSDAAVRATRVIGAVMDRGAVVIDQRGLVASLLASVSTGLLLLARARTVRVFVDTGEAARWLAGDGTFVSGRVLELAGRLHAGS
jgi:hypothetical protein